MYENYLLTLDVEALDCDLTPPPSDYGDSSPRSIDSYNNWEPPDEDDFDRGGSPRDSRFPEAWCPGRETFLGPQCDSLLPPAARAVEVDEDDDALPLEVVPDGDD
jgi:hypothetical protein